MKVSIITIVYNNKECISDCIKSVLSQTYSDIEYIVIDGGSTDGTQEVVKVFSDKISYFISEKDNGLYDALNKGIKVATGDVIGILHSDDLFYSPDTVTEVAEAFNAADTDIVYAKGLYVDKNNTAVVKRIYPSKPYRKSYLNCGWIPLHTTIYAKRELFEKFGLYDTKYSIASDYEISLRWFKNNAIKTFYLDKWVVRMRLGGKSTTAKLQKKKSSEDYDIIKRYGLLGYYTLACKIGRKIPQYLLPKIFNYS